MMTTGSSGWVFLMMFKTSRPSRRLPCSQMSRMTSWGRRSSTALSASSESRAKRVRCPSSCRKPATISRMSASSSTIRMSAAICRSLARWLSSPAAGGGGLWFLARYRLGRCPAYGQRYADQCAVGPLRSRWSILQCQRPPVLFDALLHDGKTKPRAFLCTLGRHIGLKQTHAVLLGQARAIVDHLDVDPVAVAAHHRFDATAPALLLVRAFRILLDRFFGVLHDIVDRLCHQPAVTRHEDRLVAQALVEGHVAVAHLPVEHRCPHDVADVVLFHLRLGHACEGGEFVDHARDITHLSNDRVRALLEHFPVLGNGAPVLAFEALGGELYRREGVLDFVRNAACDVGPGGCALRGHELGHVVKGDDRAVVLLALLLVRDTHDKVALLPANDERHLPLRPV